VWERKWREALGKKTYMSADVIGEADKADRFPVHATTHAILDFLNISTG
jgi:hypothetical protein